MSSWDRILANGGNLAPQLTVTPVTITSGQALSPAIDVSNKALYAIEFPSAWTQAKVTFQLSRDGTTFRDFWYDGGDGEAVISSTDLLASKTVVMLPSFWYGVGFTSMKLRSGTGAAPVNQSADRALNVLLLDIQTTRQLQG